MGELAAFCTALCWSIGIFPFTEAARRLSPNTVNPTRLLLAVLMLTPVALLFFPISFATLFSFPYPEQWLWFGLSGIVGLALGDFFSFTSFAILGPRVASIFNTLSPGAALLAGYVLLSETLNGIGIVGILVTIAGVAWIILGKHENKNLHLHHGNIKKGIVFGILAALCQGVGLVFSKKAMMYDNNAHHLLAIHSIWLRMFTSTVSIYILLFVVGKVKSTHKPLLENKNNGAKFLVLGTFFGPVFGGCLAMYAISIINVSVAQTILSLVPVFALPLAYLFYKEKITLSSLIGALVAICGVFLLIWRNEISLFFT